MANTKIQIKRTTVSGRTPNTTNAANTQYIAAGELALNLTDGILYSSNGTGLITIGATQSTITTNSVVSNTVSANTVSATNVTITNGISVGNSTVNSSINSTALFSGNSSVNTVVNTTIITVSNSISNSQINPLLVFVGNSVANAQFNLTGGTSNLAVSAYSMSTGGIVTLQTAVNHGIVLTSGYTVLVNNVNAYFNTTQTLVSVPTANTLTFSFSPQKAAGALTISTVLRSNGTATVTTLANNLLTNGQTFTITGVTAGSDTRFNGTYTVANTTTANSFTYLNTATNKTVNLTSYSTASVTAKTTASISATIVTSAAHTFSAGDYITFSNVTTPTGGKLLLDNAGSVYSPAITSTTYPVISVVNSTAFTVFVATHGASDKAWGGATANIFNSTAQVTRSYDLSTTTITSPSYITLSAGIANTAVASGNVVLSNPITITVANASSKIQVTPTSIYVGNGGSNVIISANGTRFNTVGSILQTFIDGTGLSVYTLLDTDGSVNALSNAFFTNASVLTIGNTSLSTQLTPAAVQSSSMITGDVFSNVTINSSSISINPGNVYVNSSLAQFPGTLSVGQTLSLTGALGANNDTGNTNDILISSGNGIYWASNINPTLVTSNLVGSTANLSTSVNSALLSVGTSFIANSTAIVGTGYANVTTSVNSALLTVGTSFIANTTGAYHTGTINAASYTVGTTFTANATLVNAAAINVTGQVNTATFYATTSANVGTAIVANATGVYTTGTINAASHTIGTGFVANTTVLNSNTDLNVTVNNKKLSFATVNSSANVYFIQQNDDNFVFYSTNTAYGSRAVWSIYANSITSNLNFSVRTAHTGGLTIPSGVTLLDSTGSQGTSGQVLTSNGSSNVYWSTVSGGGSGVNSSAQYTWSNTQTFQANVSFTGNGIGLTTNTGAIYLNGTSDANWKIGRNTGALTKWIYTNNTIDIVTANSTNEGFVVGLVSNATYFETGYRGTFIASNVTVGNSSSNLSINSTAISSNSIVVGSTNTAIFYNINGQVNASAGAFLSNAYAALGGYGGNYLAFGQQTNFAQWIQSGFSSAATPVYYNIILNPLGGNVGISNTAPTDRLSVNGTSYLQGNVRFTQGIIDATGTQGTSGQVLASNGSSVYWTTVGSPRVVSYANGTSITANVDSTDMATQINTAVAGTLTIGAPTGTPVDGQRLMFRIRCVNAQTLSWNAIFSGSTDLALPTTTSSGSKYDYVGFMYNSTQTKWNIVAKNFGF